MSRVISQSAKVILDAIGNDQQVIEAPSRLIVEVVTCITTIVTSTLDPERQSNGNVGME